MPRRARSLLEDFDRAFERQNKRFERQLREDDRRARIEKKRRRARLLKEDQADRRRRAVENRQAARKAKISQAERDKQYHATIREAKRDHLEFVQFSFKDLSPRGFEEFVALVFEKMGYETVMRGGAGDEGVDVEARRENEFLVIQCKKFGVHHKVGSPEIQRFYGSIKHSRAQRGVFVTTSSFTEPARQFVGGKKIDLIDYAGLDEWAKIYQLGPYAKQPEPVADNLSRPIYTQASDVTTWPENESSPKKLKEWQYLVLFLLMGIAFFVCSCATFAGLSAFIQK